MTEFREGQRVTTPKGPGTVAYVRMAPPTFSVVGYVSVILDSKVDRPGGYAGTGFDPELVRPEETEVARRRRRDSVLEALVDDEELIEGVSIAAEILDLVSRVEMCSAESLTIALSVLNPQLKVVGRDGVLGRAASVLGHELEGRKESEDDDGTC